MEDCRNLSSLLKLGIDRLQLLEAIQEGQYVSESSKWRIHLEHLLTKVAIEMMTSNDVRSLCDFLEHIEFEDAMLKSKNRQMDNAVNQIQIQERGIAISKMKGQSEIKMLNSEIRILKDELDHEIQQSSCKMDYCRLHEENLVKKYHSQVRFDTNQWNGKIQALEIDIEKEGQRSERVEKQLCVNIEEIQNAMDDLRKLWMETTSEISKESQTLSHEQEQTRAQINQKREVLKDRTCVVDQDREAKRLLEEENRKFAMYLKAVVKVQAWWRGIIARKDYARYKLIHAKSVKGKSKTSHLRNSRLAK